MKILVISQYYFPEEFRINDITKALVNKGHEVVVLTGLPNYPEGKIFKGYRFFKKRKEFINGIKIIRTFEIARRKNLIFLFLNYISFMMSGMFRVLFIKRDYDVIFSYQLSPVTMVMPGIVAKNLSKKPLYIYSCDIWPESFKIYIKNENNLIFKVVKRVSNYMYSKANLIGITSKPFYNYFNEVHQVPLDKLRYLPQHAEENYLKINKTIDNSIFDFVFMGNIGKAQDIECIIEAVEYMDKELQFVVHFVGEGSFLETAKKITQDKKLSDYVISHGRHPLEDMPKFYELADACLITLKNENLIGKTVPSKLQGYMAAGKPVIGAIDGAARDIINDSNCGVCVSSSNSHDLALNMEKFVINRESIKFYGINGRNYFIENFTIDKYVTSLINDFNNLLEA